MTIYYISALALVAVLVPSDVVTGQNSDDTLPGFKSDTWPDGKVPYQIDATFEPFEKKRIMDSIAALNNDWFCVTFRKRGNQDNNYLSFIRSDGKCVSDSIGYAGNGEQAIYLSSNCSTPRYIYWVVMQALGLPAEHMRPDRDSYITIKWENIVNDYKDAFKKYAYIDSRITDVPYDINSRLHYSSDRFVITRGAKSIVAKDDPELALGNPLSPTLGDYRKLAALYCPGGTPPTPTTGPVTGEPITVTEPSDESTDTTPTPWNEYTDETTKLPPIITTTRNSGRPSNATPRPNRNPSGIPASLARSLAIAPRSKLAEDSCKCFDRPNRNGTCEGEYQYSFQWKGMRENCLRSNPTSPICNCDLASFNPCACVVSKDGASCNLYCRPPVSAAEFYSATKTRG